MRRKPLTFEEASRLAFSAQGAEMYDDEAPQCRCGHRLGAHDSVGSRPACGICFHNPPGKGCPAYTPVRQAKGCKACGHEYQQHMRPEGAYFYGCRTSGCRTSGCPCLLWAPPEPPSWVHRGLLLTLNRRILALGGGIVGCPDCEQEGAARWRCTHPASDRQFRDAYGILRAEILWCDVLSCSRHAYAAKRYYRDDSPNVIVGGIDGTTLAVLDGRARCVRHREAGDGVIADLAERGS